VIVWTVDVALARTKICDLIVSPVTVAAGVMDQVSPDESVIDETAILGSNGLAPKDSRIMRTLLAATMFGRVNLKLLPTMSFC